MSELIASETVDALPYIGMLHVPIYGFNLTLFTGWEAGVSAYVSLALVVKTLDGRQLTFEAAPTDTVGALKRRYEEKEGVAEDVIRFIYSGKVRSVFFFFFVHWCFKIVNYFDFFF